MPTYAYACKNCGHRFDAVQSFADPTLTECPECGGPLRKEYGSIGVTFNGSGFYRTDSRAADKKAAGANASGSSSSDSPSKSGGSSAGSASSKSETKASPASTGT
jgi:putative FmdB family regulatory protein